jgi:hypothetical protein
MAALGVRASLTMWAKAAAHFAAYSTRNVVETPVLAAMKMEREN